MAIITLSRQFGAGGWTLGESLAKQLNYRFVHEDMIKEVAAKANVSSNQIAGLEKEGASTLMKILDKIVSKSFIDRLLSEKYSYVDENRYVEVVQGIVEELYEQNNVIIIGRGSQFILKDREGTLNLLLVANLSHRIRFVMKKYKLSETDAEKVVKQRDQTRTRFLGFFSQDDNPDDPLLYDMVLNMNRINLEKAENLIMQLI